MLFGPQISFFYLFLLVLAARLPNVFGWSKIGICFVFLYFYYVFHFFLCFPIFPYFSILFYLLIVVSIISIFFYVSIFSYFSLFWLRLWWDTLEWGTQPSWLRRVFKYSYCENAILEFAFVIYEPARLQEDIGWAGKRTGNAAATKQYAYVKRLCEKNIVFLILILYIMKDLVLFCGILEWISYAMFVLSSILKVFFSRNDLFLNLENV